MFIACATSAGTCNVAYLPSPPSPISGKSLLLVSKNEYLATAQSRARVGDEASHAASFSRQSARRQAPNVLQSCSHRLTRTRENVADLLGAGGLSERAKCPVRGQCCGDSSQGAEAPKSVPVGQQPRDLLGVPTVPACRGPDAARPKSDSRVLVLTYRFRRPGPLAFLPFRCLLRELAPLECSQLHHIADRESACQTSQSIALRRFAEAFFTRIHVQPQ